MVKSDIWPTQEHKGGAELRTLNNLSNIGLNSTKEKMKVILTFLVVCLFVVQSHAKGKRIEITENYCVQCREHNSMKDKLLSLKRIANTLSKRYKEVSQKIRDLEECDCASRKDISL